MDGSGDGVWKKEKRNANEKVNQAEKKFKVFFPSALNRTKKVIGWVEELGQDQRLGHMQR